MVDADGATKFEDLFHVEKALDELKGGKDGMAVSVGSRAHLQDDAVAQVTSSVNVCFESRSSHILTVEPFCCQELKPLPLQLLSKTCVRFSQIDLC